MWHLYIVKCNDGTLYTGVTTNIDRRIREHNSTKRGAKYTRSRRPVELVWTKEYENRSEVQSAEYEFKKLTHKQKLEIISKNTNYTKGD